MGLGTNARSSHILKTHGFWGRNIIHAHRNLISQFVPCEKSVRRCPSLKILQDAPKTDRATFKFLKSMCFIKCEKWSLVCSENGDFQKH